MEHKVGLGYDIHRLVAGRKLVLGGVEIPHSKGLDGHSDADVLLHAVCDALLGAVGQGDIGEHFPNTDERWRNVKSTVLLEKVLDIVRRRGYCVRHVDCVIQAEEPNLKAHKPKIRAHLARCLGVDEASVNIKATTMEGLGPIGQGQGISAWAVVMVAGKAK